MSVFDDFAREVLDGVGALATGEFSAFAKEIQSDTKAYLEDSREKLQAWTKLLANGEIDGDDFSLLVKGRKDLALMTALTKAGVAQARLGRIRNKVIDLVIDSAFKIFLPI